MAVREGIEWSLMRRGVTGQYLNTQVTPLFGMALHSLRFTTLKKEVLFMLAALLDNRVAHKVLPSHVDVLRQLSLDEFVILSQLSTAARGTPIANAQLSPPRGQPVSVYTHILDNSLAESLDHKDNIPQYIDNLVRLGLVVIRPEPAASDSFYRTFARYEFLAELLPSAPRGLRIAIVPHAANLTDFGKVLRALCVC
jgi:hypothetical protein